MTPPKKKNGRLISRLVSTPQGDTRGKWQKKKWRPVISSSMLLPSSVGVSGFRRWGSCGVGPVGGLGYGLNPSNRVKFPRGYELKRFFLGQAKSWRVSGVNFCWSDVGFRDSLSQQWIERAEAEVKLLSWSYFSLVLRGRVNYVTTRCFWASMNLLGLWGSRGHHSWMWCDLKTCSWPKPKLLGCNMHVFMSTTWRAATVLNYCKINIPHKGWKFPNCVAFKISKTFPFPPKKCPKFSGRSLRPIFRPQGRGMRNLEMEGGSGQEIASGLGLAPAVLLGKTRVRPQDGHQLQLWWICKKPLVDEGRLLP